MNAQQGSNKITSQHLERKAVVYVRQSTEKQVQHNTESRRLQEGLVGRARQLGFREVELVDADLARRAGIGAGRREGFDRLIASVAVGEVGIILSREVSRLLRTDKDWCRLMEVCQVFGTLIGDEEQVYDLNLTDDQLILGIKGTMSVVELKILYMRMVAGMEAKARRGEMVRMLPPGYVYDGDGKVVKDPNRRVVEAMELVFGKFREMPSVRQTLMWFRSSGVELPVNKSVGGKMKIVWRPPTLCFIRSVLDNPFYAGAYVWGRRPTEKVVVGGRLVKRQGRQRSPEECKVCIRDHHEGYIDWECFEENQRRIRENTMNRGSDEVTGAIRQGQGLLAGLLRCGTCGRKLHVRYWGQKGTSARYSCVGDFSEGGNYCLAFGGANMDRRFGEELLKVLSPLGIEASLEALERRALSEQEREEILALGEQFPVVWNSPSCPAELKKRIIRTVVEEIIVELDKAAAQKTAAEDVEIIRRMAQRYGDDVIAGVLNMLGRKTGKGNRWTVLRVRAARTRAGIAGQSRTKEDPEIFTIAGAARHYGVSATRIERLAAAGMIGKEQAVPWAPWEIRRSELESETVQKVFTTLRRTGRLELQGDDLRNQKTLFPLE